jgi:hypothetical protein
VSATLRIQWHTIIVESRARYSSNTNDNLIVIKSNRSPNRIIQRLEQFAPNLNDGHAICTTLLVCYNIKQTGLRLTVHKSRNQKNLRIKEHLNSSNGVLQIITLGSREMDKLNKYNQICKNNSNFE